MASEIEQNTDGPDQLYTQLATEFQQPAFLLRCRHQPLRQPGSLDPILFLQVDHLSCQFLAGDRGEQGKNWMQNWVHRATVDAG
jgi:hypothetical protein